MKRLLWLVAALTAVFAFFASQPPVIARSIGTHKVGPNRSDIIIDAPAILAAKPPPQTVVVYETVTPAACANGGSSTTFCDMIHIEVDLPGTYEESYKLNIELSWDGSGGNNLGLARWRSNESDDTRPQEDSFSQGVNPKTMSVTTEPLEMYFTVVNLSGTNRGYKLRVTFEEIPFETLDIPEFGTPRPRTTFKAPTPKPKSTPTVITITRPTPVPTPRIIDGPGEDSDDRTISLSTVKDGDREPPKESAFDPVVAMVTTVLLLSGGVVGALAIRNRRRRDELL